MPTGLVCVARSSDWPFMMRSSRLTFSSLLLKLITLCSLLNFNIMSALGASLAPDGGSPKTMSETCIVGKSVSVRVYIEIPAGASTKWEFDKKTEKLEVEQIAGIPRVIDYLPYPANYGFVPETFSEVQAGGDGDPLDAVVLGIRLDNDQLVSGTAIGVIKLLDNGETDDKLLVSPTERGPMSGLKTLKELKEQYPQTLFLLESWFENYKGKNVVVSNGAFNEQIACEVLHKSWMD